MKQSFLALVFLGAAMLVIFMCGGVFTLMLVGSRSADQNAQRAATQPNSNTPASSLSTKPVPRSVSPATEAKTSPTKAEPVAQSATLRRPESLMDQIKEPRKQFVREWKAKTGSFSTKATLVSFSEGKVKLTKEDGKSVDVPLDKLSESDQFHVGQQIKSDPAAFVIFAKNPKVVDGDSIEIPETLGRNLSLHLRGLNAPGSGESGYLESKAKLTEKIHDKAIWIEWKTTSASVETEAVVYVDGRNVNLELVAEGFAKTSTTDSKEFDEQLSNAQQLAEAQAKK